MTLPDATIFAEQGTVPVEGGAVHYATAGRGPALVFAHGLGGGYLSWFQQVPAFAQHYRCVAFSHRGFLPSSDETGTPRPQFYADDLRALLDRLEIPQAIIVAQSMGGWTAMEFALAAPDRTTGLVLCGTTGSFSHEALVSLAKTSADPRVTAWQSAGIHPAAGERMMVEQPSLYQQFVAISRSSGSWDRAPVRAKLDAMRIRRIADFRSLDCPILALVGAEDAICPPGNVEVFAAALRQTQLSIVSQAGHSVYFERAERFNATVAEFLRRAI
jgi:pimeloyl-ACP methyl ester carboxylesterase